MNLSKLIDYAMSNHESGDGHLEFEIRFGKYNRISSNIRPATFFKIFARAPANKKYELIEELFFDSNSKDPIRERTTYKDSKNIIKKIFSDSLPVKEEDLKDLYMKYKNTPSERQYISKSKVMKGDITNLFKSEIVRENIHNSLNNTYRQKPVLKKYKLRCSWLDKMWIYDMTILFVEDIAASKSGVFYEVEIEYDNSAVLKNKYTYDEVLMEATKHMNYITTVIDCAKMANIETEIKYSLYNAVVTLERANLPQLQNALYSVVDKADGERRFIYIDDKGSIFQYNPTEGYINKILILKNTKITTKNTLIDCELITLPTGQYFYGFDLLFFKNDDYRNYNLVERIELLKKVIAELNKIDKISGFSYAVKTFYFEAFKNVKYIWENRAKLFPYNLDGLIFTPIRGTYLGNLPNFKYKPLISIDVRLLYNRDINFTEFHANGYPINVKGNIINSFTVRQSNKTYYKAKIFMDDNTLKRMGAVNNRGILGVHGRVENQQDMLNIVEMEFNPVDSRWHFLRVRNDKDIPNSHLSIISVLNAIKDNITIDELSKLKHIKSPFEEIGGEYKSCFTRVGFSFDKSDSEVLKIYDSIYTKIFNEAAGKSILVLGCDVNILRGVCASKYTDITIIEPNCLEVYGRDLSEGYNGLLSEINNIGPKGKKINIIWGGTDISDGLKAFTKVGQQLLNASSEKNKEKNKAGGAKYDTVFIKSFEFTIYDGKKFSKQQWSKYMKVLKSICQKYIIGMYFSGDKILSYLQEQDCLILKNKELHPLWKLYIENSKISKSVDLFKSKDITMIEIQRAQNSFISEYQPIVFDENISHLLEESELDPDMCESVKSVVSRNNISTNEYNNIILDLTKYFIISMV